MPGPGPSWDRCRRASSRPGAARHVEHVPDKVTDAVRDRSVILPPIARGEGPMCRDRAGRVAVRRSRR
jgi:hypothetical protein